MEKRSIIAIPEPGKFWDRVYDRLYAVFERKQYPGKFTLLVTAIPRDRAQTPVRYQEVLDYQGIAKQREFLEGGNPIKNLDIHWDFLDKQDFDREEMKVSNSLYKSFSSKEVKGFNEYFAIGTLASYFAFPDQFTEFQVHEYPILNHHFNIKTDYYLSIPLIQLGDLDGVVHIIFEKDGYAALNSNLDPEVLSNNVKNLIAEFSIEYEGVILAWHLASDDQILNRKLRIEIDKVGKEFTDKDKKNRNKDYDIFWQSDANPILHILKYKEYYTTHYPYFVSRLEQHDKVRSEIYTRILRQAVITVLLDSYAHNISAHALTTLSWIFSKRSEYIARRELRRAIEDINPTRLSNTRYKELAKYDGAYEALINLRGPVSIELYPFLKFLQEKGGFWSGLTRDFNPGGISANLFNVLWEDFICNSFYLGTIADSEDIRKIHIDITFYKQDKDPCALIIHPEILFKGHLTTICLDQAVEHVYDDQKDDFYVNLPNGHKIYYDDYPETSLFSRFVQPGDDYLEIRNRLKNCQIFLPGGVVGKHALFNIIENELRNIKHFSGEELQQAQTQGLTLNISIQELSLDEKNQDELYRIGVWLGVLANIEHQERITGSPYLVKRRFDILWDDIIEEENNYQPKLSGNSQDKICAAMLFNNRFSSVQNGAKVWHGFLLPSDTLPRDRAFYPWITPAVLSADEKTEFRILTAGKKQSEEEYDTFEPTLNSEFEGLYASFNRQNQDQSGKGYLKKYFNVWRSEDIRTNDKNASEWDNMGRFRIVYSDGSQKNLSELRKSGVVRIINGDCQHDLSDPNVALTASYKDWLRTFITEDQLAIYFIDEKRYPYGLVTFDKNDPDLLHYYSESKISSTVDMPFAKVVADVESYLPGLHTYQEVQFAHASDRAGNTALQYRRHGVMNRYFKASKETKGLDLMDIPAYRFVEWFEMMVTRICVIDNRIQHRMRISGRPAQFFRDNLQLLLCTEDSPEPEEKMWLDEWHHESTQEFVKTCHFLVLHLSFIESVLQSKYTMESDYEDGNIGLFIEKELLPLFGGKLPDNFILTITTGRGRNKWWDILTQRYTQFQHHVIFRPIESLLSAVEGISVQKDDFELKYRFTKVLFGS